MTHEAQYQNYLNDLAKKYDTTPALIEKANQAFSGGNDELYAKIVGDGWNTTLRQCIEYVIAN